MIFIAVLGVLLYLLFFRGWLFKGIIFVFGYIGIYLCMNVWIPSSSQPCFTIPIGDQAFSMSWAMVVPTAVFLLAIATTKFKAKQNYENF
jgi:hypothetical protein